MIVKTDSGYEGFEFKVFPILSQEEEEKQYQGVIVYFDGNTLVVSDSVTDTIEEVYRQLIAYL